MTGKPSLLLHACCGPCASGVLERLTELYEVTVFWYNPNIDTAEEHDKRLDALRLLLTHFPQVKLVTGTYDVQAYEEAVRDHREAPEGGSRCEICFLLRMGKTAETAREGGYDLWTTTLSISPHKNAALLNEIGNRLAKETDTCYLEADFKKKNGYLRSIQLSKEYGLYRQQYCGCKYARNSIGRPDGIRKGKTMEKKLKVGILGATGMVGQRFISLLNEHPWFEVTTLAASSRSAGKRYEDAVGARWKIDKPMPECVKDMIVMDVSDVDAVAGTVDFVFSAVDMSKDEIRAIEEAYAKTETPVVSNNSAHRWTPDVPMVIPEINPEHYDVIKYQKERLGTTRGFIAVKPNCSIQSYAPCLAAWKEFEPEELVVSTYQAISGAGKTFKDWPEMVENIIPYIGGEEEKSEQEPLRVFGKIVDGKIVKAELPRISCTCIRVPVLNGHTAAVSIRFKNKPTKEQLIEKLRAYKGIPQERELPSAPKQFIQYLEEDNRPQVLADVNYENGMGVSIGRIREDNVYDFKFVGLSHNTIRGAAGGAVLSAEALVSLGYIQAK